MLVSHGNSGQTPEVVVHSTWQWQSEWSESAKTASNEDEGKVKNLQNWWNSQGKRATVVAQLRIMNEGESMNCGTVRFATTRKLAQGRRVAFSSSRPVKRPWEKEKSACGRDRELEKQEEREA